MKSRRRARRAIKLRPELVPQPLWGVTACRLLRARAPWKAIRNATLKAAGDRCSICGHTSPPLFCHEQWRHNDKNGVVTLVGFQIVCQGCNRAVHIGLAGARGELAEAIGQLRRVNRMAEQEANRMVDRATATWERRSSKHWRVFVAPRLLKTFPQLRVLEGVDTRSVAWSRDGIVSV